MIKRGNISFGDFRRLSLKEQVIKDADSVTDKDDNTIYLITSLFSTASDIALLDKNGNAVAANLPASPNLTVPLVFEGGFTATGTNLVVVYSRVTQLAP